MSEEDALWSAIGAAPDDSGLRLIAADWFRDKGDDDTADALVATSDRVPKAMRPWWARADLFYFYGCEAAESMKRDAHAVPIAVRRKMGDYPGVGRMIGFPTAEAAVRDLCWAWVEVNRVRAPV